MSPGSVGNIQGWFCVVLGPPTEGVGAVAGLHLFAWLILLLCLPLPLAVSPSFILLLPHQLHIDEWKGISSVRGQRECGACLQTWARGVLHSLSFSSMDTLDQHKGAGQAEGVADPVALSLDPERVSALAGSL